MFLQVHGHLASNQVSHIRKSCGLRGKGGGGGGGGGGVRSHKVIDVTSGSGSCVPLGVAEQVQSDHGSMSRWGRGGGEWSGGSGLRAEIFLSCS